MQFNAPPGWPQPPVGWTPPAGWQPDHSWPPAPAGWTFWVPAHPVEHHDVATTELLRPPPLRWAPSAVAGLVAAVAIAVLVTSVISAVLRTSGEGLGAAADPRPSPAATATTAASAGPAATAATAVPATEAGAAGTSLAALARVPVKGRAPRTGYERAAFGAAWSDTDRNGCDTRDDVLRRDLHAYVLKAGTHGCVVLRGTLDDPYTGRSVAFVRGPGTSSRVQVDHVVPLADAWQKGAQQWDAARREQFANDPLNLLAVDGPTNRRKGDGDAATWLPPDTGYRCQYVARQVAVKAAYGLWMTDAERSASARVLAGCPQQRGPAATPFHLGGGPVETVPPGR
ncbi:hypothetical protein GCM10027446_12860 [Angustibacter peucedani]